MGWVTLPQRITNKLAKQFAGQTDCAFNTGNECSTSPEYAREYRQGHDLNDVTQCHIV